MATDKIQQALLKQFEKHRIIFWYDRKQELRSDFESLKLPAVEKIELHRNEFAVKYHILRAEPQQKFLLYHEGPQPADFDNWLLDVLLAYGEFRTDQVSIWLSQLELGPEYAEVVAQHEAFYRASNRVDALKQLVDSHASLDKMRLKMLAVCTNTNAQLDEILESLLAELAAEQDDAENLIMRCNLAEFLWKRVSQDYGYTSKTQNIKDFALQLFKSCYALGTGDEADLNPTALVFFKRWKDGRQNGEAFSTLSERFAKLFHISHDLQSRDYYDVIDLDYYRLIDQKIIHGLVQDVTSQNISMHECEDIISRRRFGFWYHEFEDIYLAIEHAARFIHELDKLSLTMHSLTDGVQRYVKSWYLIDQLYRQFTYRVRRSSQPTLLQNLASYIENMYTNNFLLVLNDNWQSFVDEADTWRIPGITAQTDFFPLYIEPVVNNQATKKIYVIISDALRYEIADELASLIRRQDRYGAEVEPMVAVIPSYTQLGMAALLPHRELEITAKNGASVVFVDGKDSRGIKNRNAILNASIKGRGIALQAEDFLQKTVEETREIARNHDVVYLYHNRIDAVGDKRDTEERVFEAVDDVFDELLKLIKKLANANANNIIITADHGFIYQNDELAESDYLSVAPQGDIIDTDRRFVLGNRLIEHASLKSFTSSEVGLAGDLDIQIPKSINRLRKKGSGSRYVHGGTSLQEIVLPVIKINKRRTSDVRYVEVSIVRGVNQVITAGQLTVMLYQKEPVTEKIQPRTLRIGLYTREGKLISDSLDIEFILTSENERDREHRVRLILSKDADASNGQNVYVRLLEREEGTSHDVEYDSVEYLLRRSFTSDFDF